MVWFSRKKRNDVRNVGRTRSHNRFITVINIIAEAVVTTDITFYRNVTIGNSNIMYELKSTEPRALPRGRRSNIYVVRRRVNK